MNLETPILRRPSDFGNLHLTLDLWTCKSIKEFTYLGYKNKSCNVTGFHSCFLICNAKNYLYSKNYCIHRVRQRYFALSSPSSLANSSVENPSAHRVEEKFFHMLFYLQLVSTKTYLQERGQLCQRNTEWKTHYFFSYMNSWSPIIEENLPIIFIRRTWHLVTKGPRGSPLLSMKSNQMQAVSLWPMGLPAQVICSMTK